MPAENFQKYNYVDENDKAVVQAVLSAGKMADKMIEGSEGVFVKNKYRGAVKGNNKE